MFILPCREFHLIALICWVFDLQVSLDLASFEVVQYCWDALQQALSEGLLHTVFANEEEAAALLKAAASAKDQPGSAASNSAQTDGQPADPAGSSRGRSDNAPAAGSGDTMSNGADSRADGGRAAAADSSSAAERDLLGDGTVAAAQRWLLQHCQVAVVSLGPKGCVARARNGPAAACTADRCTSAVIKGHTRISPHTYNICVDDGDMDPCGRRSDVGLRREGS